MSAVGVLVAFALPAVYESAAVVEVHAALPRTVTPAAVEQTVRALSSDPTLLTTLARYGDGGDESLDQALERTRSAVAISVRPDGAFRVAFSAPGPESAQRGCRDLTEALTRDLSSPDVASGPEVKKKQAELEQRTRDLTLFVATHPEVMGQAEPAPAQHEAAGPRVDAHAADANDPTLLVLRQEKRRLEAELGSRAAAPAPSSVFGPNPYDEPPHGADTTTIQRRLSELRLAIFAHQRALAAEGGATDTGKAAPRATDPALTAEWRKLVQAVIDAQKGVSVVAPPAFEARVVETASLPSRPTKPNRPLVTALGAVAGMWASLLFALFRSRKHDSRKRAQAARATKAGKLDSGRPPEPALTDGMGAAPTKQLVEPARDAEPVAQPAVVGRSDPPGARTPSDAPARPGAPIVPNAMVSPRTTDTAAQRSSSPAAFTKTLVAGSGASTLSPVPPAPHRPGSDPGRRSSNPPRPDPNRSRRPSSNPPPQQTTMAASDPTRRTATYAAPAPGSDPPPRAPSELPHAARSTLRPPPKAPSDPPPRQPEASQPPPRAEGRQSVPPPRRTLSPPPMTPSAVPAQRGDSAPDTRRVGTPEPSPLRASSMPQASPPPAERPDTTYSIVDKSRRPSSRTPEPAPERRLSDRGTRPLTTDPTGVLKPLVEEPRAYSSNRPRPSVQSDTRPGWAIPGSSPTAARGEVVRPSSAPPPAKDEGVVRPLSVPPSWRPPPLQQTPESEITQLRDQILAQRNGQCFVVGITSDPDSLANKSALAMRLAMLLSETPARVLIMEANFDFPAVHRVLGIDMPRLAGFSQQIHARIRTGEQAPWKVVRCSTNLDVLGEGFMRSPGVSFSREFSEAVVELRRGYDFIVADGPTASAGADCKPLNSLADGLVVAVHPGAKLADAMERAARWFTRKELMAAVFVDVK